MAEGQSRYGIMEELNQKKIAVRQELANLERELDETKFQAELKQKQIEAEIAKRDFSYEREYKVWLREKQVAMAMAISNHQRYIDSLQEEMQNKRDNYAGDHLAWRDAKEKELKVFESDIKRFIADRSSKIKEKQEIITEIEKAVDNLKEMSKEQKEIK